ncbi:2-hydroxyacid dehydrogenase [Hydrocarboniclastica marina]|uniref:2-hydroxyacid dehydrogenase n=1 Tax=Hydrocarboniclastica marina TaxID=2259620 RepID=A0A4P7XKR1_9ALTE|nr:2-hydroxyacid dehydrogenase [Hydrocarboniclastica marina]QCF27495.1 2-hydroxyacid dehydrogenase [Hydrocarboniclastica marina]
MKAVFLDGYSLDRGDLDFSALRAQVDSLVIYPQTRPEEVATRLAGYDIVLTNKVPLGRQSLQDSAIKMVCVAATGTNNIDLQACRALGIAVTNCQGYGTDSVAQHTLALMLNLSSRMPDYARAVSAGHWHTSSQFCLLDYPIHEMAGKTLGIVGYGTLGQRVAQLGNAFGMNILVSARPGSAASNGRVDFDELLERVDFLSLHCPLTETTHHLMSTREFSLMKRSAYLINTARGGLVDETALAGALEHGDIAGAGLDVVDGEPPAAQSPLFVRPLPNLIITPHCGWGALEARQRIVGQIAENIRSWQGGAPVRVVA